MSYADTKMEEAAQQQTDTESTRARRRFRRPSNHSRGIEDEWNFEVLAFHPKDRGPVLVRLRIMDSPSYWRRATTESYEDGTFKDGWFERLEQEPFHFVALQPRALPRLTWEESAAPAQIWSQTGWDGIQAPSAKPPPRKKRAAKK